MCFPVVECKVDLLLQAFVVFGDAEEAQKACLKDREIFCEGDKFGDRYVRVYPTVESDLPDIQECLAAASSAQNQEVQSAGLIYSVLLLLSYLMVMSCSLEHEAKR